MEKSRDRVIDKVKIFDFFAKKAGVKEIHSSRSVMLEVHQVIWFLLEGEDEWSNKYHYLADGIGLVKVPDEDLRGKEETLRFDLPRKVKEKIIDDACSNEFGIVITVDGKEDVPFIPKARSLEELAIMVDLERA